MKRPRVLILGGGFAGLACAAQLDARKFAVTLVDRKRDFEFLPNIHELLSGVKKPSQLRLPLGVQMRAAGHRFVRAEVDGVDPELHTLKLGRKELHGDFLVLAAGSVDTDYGISGVSEHTMGFKSVAQCHAISQRLKTLREQGGASVIIVGGGLAGIEALGELLRNDVNNNLRLTIIDAQERLLPGNPAAVARHLGQYCKDREVMCINGDAVSRITPKTVFLGSGRRIRSDLTIWAGGSTPPTLFSSCGLAETGSWASVRNTLEHSVYPRVFVAGDAAELPRSLPKQAYHALDMGRCAGKNIERAATGKRLRPFKPAPKPTLIAFGDIDTILITDRIAYASPALAAGKEAIFASVMTQLDRRPGRERLNQLVKHGRSAGRTLLWPAIKNPQSLRHQVKVKRLK